MAQPTEEVCRRYWKANISLLQVLLVIWAVFGLLIPFVFVEAVNSVPFFGFKLGFWFAQQGSIFVFLALIFVYAWRMNKIEEDLGLDE